MLQSLSKRPSDKTVIRSLVLLVLILALLGGFFHAQLQTLKRRYAVLTIKYERLVSKNQTESRP